MVVCPLCGKEHVLWTHFVLPWGEPGMGHKSCQIAQIVAVDLPPSRALGARFRCCCGELFPTDDNSFMAHLLAVDLVVHVAEARLVGAM